MIRNILTSVVRTGARCSIFSNQLFYNRFSTMIKPTLTLYSKNEGCSLCDDAKQEIFKHGEKFVYEEVDITAPGNEVWFELYKYDIPVVHINNVEVMRHRVFEYALVDALANATSQMNR